MGSNPTLSVFKSVMFSRSEKKNKIDIIMEAIWLAVIFLIPLYFDRGLHNIFEIPKNILLQSLVEVLLLVYLIKLVLLPKKKIFLWSKVLWARIKYLVSGFIFIFILGISTIFSQIRWFSFWGSWERRMGYLAWLHFFIFALILLLSIRNKKQIYRLLIAISAAAFFVGAYGIIQSFNLDPFLWSYDPFLTGRIFSATGQPNFLGSWLLLVIPVVLFGMTRKNFLLKITSFLLLVLLTVALFLTKSRGAWVGLISMLGFISFFFFWRKNKKLVIIPVLCLLIMISFLIYLNQKSVVAQESSISPFLNRLQTFTNLKETGQYRLFHWQASWDLIKQRPILGYGLGSQRFNLPRYYRPEFAAYEKASIYLDYAHNDILDTLLAAGFLGLAAYLFLISYTFWLGLKYYLRNKQKQISTSQTLVFLILAGLFGYLVSILFSFHVMSTLLYFWLFIIMVIVLSRDLIHKRIAQRPILKLVNFWQSLLIILFLGLTIFCFWQFNARLYLSSGYFLDAKESKMIGNYQKSINQYQKAIKFSPDDPYFRQEFALSLYQISFLIPTPDSSDSRANPDLKKKLAWLDLGIENIEKIPPNIRPIEALVWLPWLKAEKAYLTQTTTDFAEAETSYQQVAQFSQQSALIYNHWCALKIYQQDWPAAIKMCEKAIALYPDLSHPHMNEEHRRDVINEMLPAYVNLASVYQKLGKPEKAIDYYQKSVYFIVEAFSPPYPELLKQVYERLIQTYENQADFKSALFWANHAHILWPEDSEWISLLNSFYLIRDKF